MNKVQVEVWVMIDENGDYEVAKEAGDLQAEPGLASRMVKVTVSLPVPKPAEVEVDIEDEETVTVK